MRLGCGRSSTWCPAVFAVRCQHPRGMTPAFLILPGVSAACCGHGDSNEAYLMYGDGSRVWRTGLMRMTELGGRPPSRLIRSGTEVRSSKTLCLDVGARPARRSAQRRNAGRAGEAPLTALVASHARVELESRSRRAIASRGNVPPKRGDASDAARLEPTVSVLPSARPARRPRIPAGAGSRPIPVERRRAAGPRAERRVADRLLPGHAVSRAPRWERPGRPRDGGHRCERVVRDRL